MSARIVLYGARLFDLSTPTTRLDRRLAFARGHQVYSPAVPSLAAIGDLHARELWEGVGRSALVHGATVADEARLGVNPMKPSSHRVGHRAGNLASRTTTHLQMVESSEDKDGGRYRIRTYDFHRVNESSGRKQ